MEFCNLMQKLINNPRLSKITSDLRSGMLVLSTILVTEHFVFNQCLVYSIISPPCNLPSNAKYLIMCYFSVWY